MPETIAAHGGVLIDRFVPASQRPAETELANSLPSITLSRRQISDLELIATGAASPLTGFMNREDYFSVVRTMHLVNGLPWSIPVTLSVDSSQAFALSEGDVVAQLGFDVGTLSVSEVAVTLGVAVGLKDE